MKTLLIYPRFWEFSSPPLGLAYISANMKDKGLDVELMDCTFNTTMEDVKERIKRYDPDIIGLSLMTRMVKGLDDFIADIKEVNPDLTIVAGGPHPSILPVETLQKYDVDIAVLGEGEHIMVELVNALEGNGKLEKVNGIVYKENGRIRTNKREEPIENLDELPFPDRDSLPMKEYIKATEGRSSWSVPRPSTTIMGSRGCPYRCTFCAAHLIHGRKIRLRNPENIAEEIEDLVNKYRLRGIWFNDDSFTVNKKWVLDIFDELKKRGVDIKWGCNTRVNLVDRSILEKMKENGCRFVSFGVESGVQDVLNKYLKKGTKLEQIEKAFKTASEVGIFTQATFMVGTPGETIEDMRKSIEFAKKIEPDAIQVSITTPLPGTEIVDIAKNLGEIDVTDWEEIDYMWHGVIRTKDFVPEQVRKAQKEFLKKFYFRPGYFLAQLRRIRSKQDLETRIRGFYQLMGSTISPLSIFEKEISYRKLD